MSTLKTMRLHIISGSMERKARGVCAKNKEPILYKVLCMLQLSFSGDDVYKN